jgi:hypothetical protein
MKDRWSFFYPRDENEFPKQSKFTINLTYIFIVLGVGIGIILLIISRGSPYFSEAEIDNLPDFGPFTKWVGTILLVLAVISLAVNLLFVRKKRIGWVLLTSIYTGGSALTFYYLYLGVKLMIEHSLFAIPFPLLTLLVIGIIGLYTLLHKNTLGFFFSKSL